METFRNLSIEFPESTWLNVLISTYKKSKAAANVMESSHLFEAKELPGIIETKISITLPSKANLQKAPVLEWVHFQEWCVFTVWLFYQMLAPGQEVLYRKKGTGEIENGDDHQLISQPYKLLMSPVSRQFHPGMFMRPGRSTNQKNKWV